MTGPYSVLLISSHVANFTVEPLRVDGLADAVELFLSEVFDVLPPLFSDEVLPSAEFTEELLPPP